MHGDTDDRTISTSVLCARCGYNLRHAPFVGRCPECGSTYNARPLIQKGTFSHFDLRFPWSDAIVSLICIAFGTVNLVGASLTTSEAGMLAGLVFVVLGTLLLPSVCRDSLRFIRFHRILRETQEEETDQG